MEAQPQMSIYSGAGEEAAEAIIADCYKLAEQYAGTEIMVVYYMEPDYETETVLRKHYATVDRLPPFFYGTVSTVQDLDGVIRTTRALAGTRAKLMVIRIWTPSGEAIVWKEPLVLPEACGPLAIIADPPTVGQGFDRMFDQRYKLRIHPGSALGVFYLYGFVDRASSKVSLVNVDFLPTDYVARFAAVSLALGVLLMGALVTLVAQLVLHSWPHALVAGAVAVALVLLRLLLKPRLFEGLVQSSQRDIYRQNARWGRRSEAVERSLA